MENKTQVKDDPELLNLMLSDEESAPEIYRPAARWKGYSESLVTYIRKNGLRDFRCTRAEEAKVLSSFAARDIMPLSAHATPDRLMEAVRSAKRGKSALPIEMLPASRVASPEGFEKNGNFYCLTWLNFYLRYAYVTRFLDLDEKIIVEIGPGSGKQAEMLKKAHPTLTIILLDIVPQVYVCNQYLEKVLGGDVVGYRVAREFTSFEQIKRGKINIIPNWRAGILRDRHFDLLWNAASFQEMQPKIVSHYMKECAGAEALYLLHNIKPDADGNLTVKGSISPRYLGNFEEIDIEKAKLALTPHVWSYYDSFWCKTKPR